MRSITRQKERDAIVASLERYTRVYIAGCGTCATMCKTGGVREVLETAQFLEQQGKEIVGWTVIPTACDELSHEILKQEQEKLLRAEAVLEMSCGFGNQQIAGGTELPVIPGNDTISMGLEFQEGSYTSACTQCGQCMLAVTGSICPMVMCPKTMGNGPCGGTDNGKCEVDKEKDCAWTLMYTRLEAQGREDELRAYQPPRDYERALKPVCYRIDSG